MSDRRLILVDGTAVLYRSFYAIKDLSTRAGKPTNAVFGFIRKLQQIQESWKPSHWAVVYDGGTPEDRLELLPEYKAQRPPMPDALRGQVDLSKDYLVRADVAVMMQEGVEADDLMASVAAWAEPDVAEVLIATSDKDLYQVVTDRIRILPLAGDEQVMGPEEVRQKTGVAPEQIVEWLALAGDSVDNIPGVPGVGAKTAAKLLAQYGEVDNLLRRLEEVPSLRLRKALEDNRATIERNLQIVRLRKDLARGCEWEKLRACPPSPGRLLPFLRELEFESLARKLEQGELALG